MKKCIFLILVMLLSPVFSSSFKIAVLPDTQYYSKNDSSIFNTQTQWIVDNKASQSIAFVTHLGDVVNNGNQSGQEYQWTNADTAIDKLDGIVPYSICMGNHDYDVVSDKNDPFGNGASVFKTYFGSSRYAPYTGTWYKGSSPQGLSHYQIFSAGGRQWLHFNFEWESDNSILMWAQNIIDDNPTLPVIISTHAFKSLHDESDPASTGLKGATQGPAANGGYNIWHKFVKHNDQIFMVINGHYASESHITLPNIYGNNVFMVSTDFQYRDNGGDGWMNLIEFNSDTDAINVKTYSPKLTDWETDANSQFTFNIDFDTRLSNFHTREAVNGIPAGNIWYNSSTSGISIPTDQRTEDFNVVGAYNTGDYDIQIGDSNEDDTLGGVLISSIAENGRIAGSAGYRWFHTSAANIGGRGQQTIGISTAAMEYLNQYGGITPYDGGEESDCNVAAAYFPFSDFIGAHCQRLVESGEHIKIYSAAGNGVVLGVNLTQYPNSNEDPELLVPHIGGNNWSQVDGDRGIFEFNLPDVNSLTDGVVLANINDNGYNHTTVSPHTDGKGWQIAVIHTTGINTACSGFSFVYVPYSTPGIVAGRFKHNSCQIVAGTKGFKVEPIADGITRLSIAGRTPADGVLLVQGENQYYSADDYHTYQPDDVNGCWIIESRDLPVSGLAGALTEHYVFVFVPFDGQSAEPPFAGSGTAGDPYQITSKEQLEAVSYWPSAYYKLMNNINLNDTPYNNSLIAIDNIGSDDSFNGTMFTGSFDGQGYTIQNLTISAAGHDHVGLFGKIGDGGHVSNLTLSNVNISSDCNYVGAISGEGNGSVISNCHISGAVTGGVYVGGLIGSISGYAVTTSCTITNCSSSGTVTGTGAYYVGGLVGTTNRSTISYCNSSSTVTGLARCGGLIGNHYLSSVDHSYATGNVTGNGGSVEKAYVGGFIGQCNNSDANYCYATGSVIGGDSVDRVGGFVGNAVASSKIDNSYATGNVTASGLYTGGFAGTNQQADIEDSYAKGSVSVTLNSSSAEGTDVGGFVGCNYASSSASVAINRCYATGDTTGIGQVGGFVGRNLGNTATYTANITKCYATGNVQAKYYVGGFCGREITYGYISQSYATGNATGMDKASGGETEAGGFIGRMSGNSFVDNCYSTGSASVAYKRAGGFVGGHWGTLTNCYSTGTATGPAEVGGFCGTGTAANSGCYWDVQTSDLETSTIATGKTTAQMKQLTTFTGWDFTTAPIWKIRETLSYPKLNWQTFVGGDIDYDNAVDFADLTIIVDNWLATGSGLAGDIYVDNTVDFRDFAKFAEDWCNQ